MFRTVAALSALLLAACGGDPTETSTQENAASAEVETAADPGPLSELEETASVDQLAEELVKISLAAGVHDPAFVDAYHGPEEWREAAQSAARPLEEVEQDAADLLDRIAAVDGEPGDVRLAMLEKLARAAHARIRIAQGTEFDFNEETRLLYDAVAPKYDVRDFHAALAEIDGLIPGDAPLHERVNAFRESLAIPEDRLSDVFDAAIAECRERTLARYNLPETESFRIEYVTGKPWSGYNWYQGDYESLIQVNTDLPIIIDRAVDLGCHEGYPGHHTWNVLLERDILNELGWIEYSLYPLFSPLSITAEGSANYGIELAFPGDEKVQFERETLYPIAGLDPEKAATLDQLNSARRKLSHAGNHIARLYLNGEIDREEAIRMEMEFGLQSRQRAEKAVDFIETYRGYVINYNLGLDLVESYVERKAGEDGDRWAAFETLLTTPLAASDIKAAK